MNIPQVFYGVENRILLGNVPYIGWVIAQVVCKDPKRGLTGLDGRGAIVVQPNQQHWAAIAWDGSTPYSKASYRCWPCVFKSCGSNVVSVRPKKPSGPVSRLRLAWICGKSSQAPYQVEASPARDATPQFHLNLPPTCDFPATDDIEDSGPSFRCNYAARALACSRRCSVSLLASHCLTYPKTCSLLRCEPIRNTDSTPMERDPTGNESSRPDGDKMLTEEVKWQTVTHKSFDQGRRGFNERLSYLGKQIVHLQASLSLLESSSVSSPQKLEDPYGRTPFEHPSLQGLDALTEDNKNMRINRTKLAALAEQYKLGEVLRWVPRYRNDLPGSGLEVVLTQAIYAVVGAVALEKGGAVANQVARDSILKPLGFDIGMPRDTL
ncbi:hypothetical protein RJZ90_000546 [Blastomyces dermatitidis]